MPGATEKLGDGVAVGKQAGGWQTTGKGWQRTAFAGIQATGGESGRLEGDAASSDDVAKSAVRSSRSQVTKMWVVGASHAADVLQAVDRWVLCIGIGANRGTTHGQERSDTTALR